MVNHTKIGPNWPHLGPRRIGPFALIADQWRDPGTNHWYHHTPTHHYELCGKYQGSNLPLARNMHENRKSQILWKPGHSCFESHQSWMKGPGPVSCLDIFSPNFMDCTKAMAPGDRACGIRWIHQSDACPIRKVHSLASSRAVATLTICWCYRSLLLIKYYPCPSIVNATANLSAYLAHFHFLNRHANLVIFTNG